jgi:hypothetical protein
MSVRLASAFAAVVVTLALAASPASASLADEVTAGKAVAAQLQAGQANCTALTDTRFEHLGEYVMDRMVGSRAAHSAMNARMEQAIGTENTERMHELIGRRFAGCQSGDASSVPAGPGMMSSGAAMMDSPAWSWMRNGAWQHMSSADWSGVARPMMGSRYSNHHGWSTGAAILAAVGALLLGGLLALVFLPRARRRPPAAA